ncbi:disease resistance protein RML1A isoform X2 [Raphanus sativus]|uniref:Disease resistance protein RML1A isoform X2 n=1 Tax=Raphanus sativus TaxID=3726 RepID=A0A6J0MZI4_RAPSA|nr:disease resistance protein RML1A isoform X2 [Raphanus sativus]
MASSSSAVNIFHVFTSFHGPDVRRGFLSHLQSHFESKGIKMFKDQKIDRGYSIKPELFKAIGESRVCLVLLSQNYASSGWCLDELVEILRCRETLGKTVMTVFYQVDPSSVRKQKGDFGSAFMKTCQGRDEETTQGWKEALTDVANIEGEHSDNWVNEAEMIQQIAIDVSNKLNLTPSRDFDGMVGLEAHLTNLKSLLCLQCDDDVKMIGIWGPAGIGKTTIARAFYEQLPSGFSFKCFMEDLKGSYKSNGNYDSKLGLQRLLLSRILKDSDDIKVHHLGAIKEWLGDQRVLIILDDVDDLEKLEVLAKEPSWFGPGSRIIVTTEDKQILRAHGINDIYNVEFPSEEEAREIVSLHAFKETSVRDGFEELVDKVAGFCSNLPLDLAVVGSALRGRSKTEWEHHLDKIETSLDLGKIDAALKVEYERLSKNDQALFLHIACFFFFREDVDRLTTMLAHSKLDVGNGLKTLKEKSLVHISFNSEIVMPSLLQKLGRKIVVEQSDEPGKRQFLIDPQEICDVLADETGTGSLIGIVFDMSNMEKFSISKGAFEGMRNLQFLQIYSQMGQQNENVSCLHIQEDLEYLPRLRLLSWNFYPGKSLPPTFKPERLVELHMQFSNLEKLWDGIQPLANLKKIDLAYSSRLKEIPDLSKATNLETLLLPSCSSLVELPSSIKNLHKLKSLKMKRCKKLRLIPTNINLASLKIVDMDECSQLETFPDISRNIKTLSARDTGIKDVPASVVGRWSRCRKFEIGNKSLEILTHVPPSVVSLDLINSDIKKIPECITGLSHLVDLIVENCTKLVSIPALPPSLKSLNANNCVSLKTVDCSFRNPVNVLTFYNCVELDGEARRGIIQQSVQEYTCLAGKEVPPVFTHRATGNSITIPEGTFSASSRFKACFLLSPIKNDHRFLRISCRLSGKGGVRINSFFSSARLFDMPPLSEHVFIFHGNLFRAPRLNEVEVAESEITFEFSCDDNEAAELRIIECGVQILSSEVENFETESNMSDVDSTFSDDDGAYEFTSAILSVCKTTKMQKDQGILALCKYIKKQEADEEDSSSSRSEVEDFEDESIDLSSESVQEMNVSIFEYLNKKGGGNILGDGGNSLDASDKLVLHMTFSLFQYLSKKEADHSTNASKELVLAMLYLLGQYIEKQEPEGSSSGHESNEKVLKRIIISLLVYIKVNEVEGSSGSSINKEVNWGDASKELVLPVFLCLCEYIKKKEAEGNSSNNQVNNGDDGSNELLLGMILSASEKIETQEADVILSQCEDIIKEDAEGSSSSSNSEVNSGHASNKLVLAIILRLFQYIKKEAEGSSSKRDPSATRLLRIVFVGFILACCCLLAYLVSHSFV